MTSPLPLMKRSFHNSPGELAYFQRGDRDSALKECLFIKYRDKELADKLYDLMHGQKVEGVRREGRAGDE